MSEFDEDDLTRQYRRLGAPEAPAPAVRERILAYAAELAAERARGRIVPLRRPRVFRWRPALFGTMAAAALTALTLAPLLLHRLREPAKSVQVAANEPVVVELSGNEAGGSATAAPPVQILSESSPDASPPAPRVARAAAPPPPTEARLAANLTARSAPAAAGASAEAKATQAAALDATQVAGGASVRPALIAGRPGAPAPVSALPELAAQGATERVRALLEEGSPVDARDARGRTALLGAVEGGHLDTARVLLEHGADPRLADGSGLTPLAAAERGGRADLAALLRQHGAR